LADTYQLFATPGWQTLEAILQSTGERIPKRPRPASGDGYQLDPASLSSVSPSSVSSSTASLDHQKPRAGEPLTKRLAAVRLNERNTSKDNQRGDSGGSADERPPSREKPHYDRKQFKDL